MDPAWRRTVVAGAVYGAVALLTGTLLGVMRVVVVAPRLGPVAATAIELPLILAACWWTCLRLCDRFRVPSATGHRAVMGIVGLACLLAGEAALAAAFGPAPAGQGSGQAVAMALGAAGQGLFATLPVLAGRFRPPPR